MAKKSEKMTGKPYEELIYSIYKQLEPQADTRLNDKIPGLDSGIDREIDISMRYQVAGHDLLIIVQAKDHKKPADIKILGEFASVIQDVRASKGILICSSGFTKSAKNYAKSKGIELCSAHDASAMDWQTKVEIPVIKRKTIINIHASKMEAPKIIHTSLGMTLKPGDSIEYLITDSNNVEVDIYEILFADWFDRFVKHWDTNKVVSKVGKYEVAEGYNIFGNGILRDGRIIRGMIDKIVFDYTVTHRYYFKYIQLNCYKGIKNYITDDFSLSEISIENEMAWVIDKSWTHIDNIDELSFRGSTLFLEHFALTNRLRGYFSNIGRASWIKNNRELEIFKKKVSDVSK